VVDVNGRQLLVYRDPRAGDYPPPQVFALTDAIAPLAAPAASICVADMLQ
jgi:hypothetical protein